MALAPSLSPGMVCPDLTWWQTPASPRESNRRPRRLASPTQMPGDWSPPHPQPPGPPPLGPMGKGLTSGPAGTLPHRARVTGESQASAVKTGLQMPAKSPAGAWPWEELQPPRSALTQEQERGAERQLLVPLQAP